MWPVLFGSREDRGKHRDVAVVVGVAVDGDEVGDAVLGGERGVMAFELPVGVREPVGALLPVRVAPLTDQARREFRRERVPVAAVKDQSARAGPLIAPISQWIRLGFWPLLIDIE